MDNWLQINARGDAGTHTEPSLFPLHPRSVPSSMAVGGGVSSCSDFSAELGPALMPCAG